MSLKKDSNETPTGKFYLSDSFEELGQYIISDQIITANELIVDNLGDALDTLSMKTSDDIFIAVNPSGTQLTGTYPPHVSSPWVGGAEIIITGEGLSDDLDDPDFSISGVSVNLTTSETPFDWENPLLQIDIGLEVTVVGSRATSFELKSFNIEAGDLSVN